MRGIPCLNKLPKGRHFFPLLFGYSQILLNTFYARFDSIFLSIPIHLHGQSLNLFLTLLQLLLKTRYLRLGCYQFVVGNKELLICSNFPFYILELFGGLITFLGDFVGKFDIFILTADEFFKKLVTFLILCLEKSGETSLCNKHGAQELFVIESDDGGYILPVGGFLYILIVFVHYAVQKCLDIVVGSTFEAHMPLGAIHISVIGLEGKFGVTGFATAC